MKSEKGITLISLIVYLIAMVIVVATVTVISGFFYKNTKGLSENIDPISEYTKFNTFFSEEVNKENIKVLDCDTNQTTKESYIVFDNGVQYTFIKENKGIYRNKVKICREVENCNFTYEIKNGKAVVSVYFTAGDKTRNTTFTLKN